MRRFKDLAFQDVRLKKTTTGLETHLLSRQTLVSFFWTFGNYNCPRKKKCCCCRSKFRFSVPDGHFCRKWKEVFWKLTKANENSLQQFLQLFGRKKNEKQLSEFRNGIYRSKSFSTSTLFIFKLLSSGSNQNQFSQLSWKTRLRSSKICWKNKWNVQEKGYCQHWRWRKNLQALLLRKTCIVRNKLSKWCSFNSKGQEESDENLNQ